MEIYCGFGLAICDVFALNVTIAICLKALALLSDLWCVRTERNDRL